MIADINRINPYIRVAMRSVLPLGFELRQRIIFDYELIYVERGQLRLCYNGKTYTCNEGQFIFLRPGVSHSFKRLETEISQPHIHFDMIYSAKSENTPVCFRDRCDLSWEELQSLSTDLFEEYPQEPLVTFSDFKKAKELFFSVIEEVNKSPLFAKSELLKLVNMLLVDKFSASLLPRTYGYSLAKQLKNFIDGRQGCAMKLEDFEKHFSYSKYYLERSFQKEFGISLIAYRNQKRMEWARELLENNSVSEVAEQLNFSSIYVFSRAFKKQFGYAPSKNNICKLQ